MFLGWISVKGESHLVDHPLHECDRETSFMFVLSPWLWFEYGRTSKVEKE